MELCHHTRLTLRGPCPRCQATFDAEGKQIMQNLTVTQWPLEDDKPLYPRRRDVREMCEEMLRVLTVHAEQDAEGNCVFNRAFLTGVRDLMREGVPFVDAVGAFASEPEVTEDDTWSQPPFSAVFPF